MLDKTGVAAIELDKFIHANLMSLPWFVEIWNRATKVKSYYDVGRHFLNEEYLGYELVVRPKETKKNTVLQYFIGSHGKTKLDGVAFGRPGVAGALEELKMLERLTTTQQLMDFCSSRKIKQQAGLTDEEKELNRWIHLVWDPKLYPSKLTRMKQKSLTSQNCWQAIPMVGYSGLAPVNIYAHGLVEDKKNKSQMQLGRDFQLVRCAPEGGGRTGWTRAAAVP